MADARVVHGIDAVADGFVCEIARLVGGVTPGDAS
jgi:hypothetical protein